MSNFHVSVNTIPEVVMISCDKYPGIVKPHHLNRFLVMHWLWYMSRAEPWWLSWGETLQLPKSYEWLKTEDRYLPSKIGDNSLSELMEYLGIKEKSLDSSYSRACDGIIEGMFEIDVNATRYTPISAQGYKLQFKGAMHEGQHRLS